MSRHCPYRSEPRQPLAATTEGRNRGLLSQPPCQLLRHAPAGLKHCRNWLVYLVRDACMADLRARIPITLHCRHRAASQSDRLPARPLSCCFVTRNGRHGTDPQASERTRSSDSSRDAARNSSASLRRKDLLLVIGGASSLAARSASVSDAKAPPHIEAVWISIPNEPRRLRMVCYRRNVLPTAAGPRR